MTQEERLREQGLMVEERREIKARLACLENKARRMELAMERAGTAFRQSHVHNWRVDPESGDLVLSLPDYEARRSAEAAPVTYPSLEEAADLLTERKALLDRLEQIDALLD